MPRGARDKATGRWDEKAGCSAVVKSDNILAVKTLLVAHQFITMRYEPGADAPIWSPISSGPG